MTQFINVTYLTTYEIVSGKFENYEEVSKLEQCNSLEFAISENDIAILEI